MISLCYFLPHMCHVTQSEIKSLLMFELVCCPSFIITGTAGDWITFEKMFLTEVDGKSISYEEKFGLARR